MPVDIGALLVGVAFRGALFALIALGFTMVFGVGGVLNLAHGALVMVGGITYAALVSDNFVASMTYHPVVGVAAALVVVGLVSLVMYLGLVQYIEDNVVITFLVTILLAVFGQEIVDFFLPETSISIALLRTTTTLPVLGQVRTERIVMFVLSWIIIGVLWYYVTRTDSGRAIRATAMSERGARLSGVNIESVRARTWLIAGLLAGVAGVFLGAQQGVDASMWLYPLTFAFIIVVVGGIGSIKGSIVAAYLIGFMETGTVLIFSPEFEGIVSLVVLIVVLLVKPQGLFGREFHHE